MSAERNPHTEASYAARLLELVTRIAVRFPWFVVGAAVLAAVVSIAYAARCMEFRASRLDLLNPESHYNKRWLAYLQEFGDEDDVVVVVEGEQRDQIVPVIESIADTISREPQRYHAVLHKNTLDMIRGKALHFVPIDQLADIENFLRQVEPVTHGNWGMLDLHKQVQGISAQLLHRPSGPAADASHNSAMANAQRVAQQLAAALSDAPTPNSIWPDDGRLAAGLKRFESGYLLTGDETMGFILLRIVRDSEQLVPGNEAIDRLRGLLSETKQRHPNIQVGLTGMPVLENDEMRSSQSDMVWATILSLFGVAVLFVAGFGGVRHPMLAVVVLVLAIAWSFGFITLAIGHLNILSVSFGVILIGLGIDFGIHYVARYHQLRLATADGATADGTAALVQTASSVGPGIISGGITTALAFSTAALTKFTGIAELGIIAGGGIVLCIVAALVVLPALIHLSDRGVTDQRIPEPIPVDTFVHFVLRWPRLVLFLSFGLSALIAYGAIWVRYDHNLLNMQPAALASVQWEKRLMAKSDRSVWFGLSVADSPDQLLKLKEKFEQLGTVHRTEEIVSLLPESSPQKQELIGRIAERLGGLPTEPPVIPIAPAEQMLSALSTLENQLRSLAAAEAAALGVARVREQLRQLPAREYYQRISQFQQSSCHELLDRLRMLAAIANPAPPHLADLPDGLRTRFVGKNNRHLLKVYALSDIWDMDELEKFVADLESVDPHVTGHPVQTFYASRHLQQSYIHAAIYSLLLVLIVLILDMRDIKMALLAVLPLCLGVLQMIGLLGLLDIPLNPANMIVLPLILGIGIDDGIHIVHDFRRQTGPYRLSRSTAIAVLLTSSTTLIGFGTMMIARHQGLRSLGQVLTIGVFCCLVTSIIVLPAILSLLSRHRAPDPGDSSRGDAERDGDEPDFADEEFDRAAAMRDLLTAEVEQHPADVPIVVRRRNRRRLTA